MLVNSALSLHSMKPAFGCKDDKCSCEQPKEPAKTEQQPVKTDNPCGSGCKGCGCCNTAK